MLHERDLAGWDRDKYLLEWDESSTEKPVPCKTLDGTSVCLGTISVIVFDIFVAFVIPTV